MAFDKSSKFIWGGGLATGSWKGVPSVACEERYRVVTKTRTPMRQLKCKSVLPPSSSRRVRAMTAKHKLLLLFVCLFVCSFFLFIVETKQAMMPPFVHGNDILWENIKEIFNDMKRGSQRMQRTKWKKGTLYLK